MMTGASLDHFFLAVHKWISSHHVGDKFSRWYFPWIVKLFLLAYIHLIRHSLFDETGWELGLLLHCTFPIPAYIIVLLKIQSVLYSWVVIALSVKRLVVDIRVNDLLHLLSSKRTVRLYNASILTFETAIKSAISHWGRDLGSIHWRGR